MAGSTLSAGRIGGAAVLVGLSVSLGCSCRPVADAPLGNQEAVGAWTLSPTPDGVDVTRHLARFRFGGDQIVRDKAAQLEGRVRRPWTVERLAAFYAAAQDPAHRAAAVYLLAASRHPTGLRVAGKALDDPVPNVAIAAAQAIELHWIGVVHGGGAEALLSTARAWWRALEGDRR